MARDFTDFIERLDAGGPVRVAGLGDSLTDGWQVRRGFFPRFVDGLRARWPAAAIEADAAGVPGDMAAGGRQRVAGLAARRPDLTSVQFGINDCFAGVDPADFSRDLRAIAEALVAAGSQVVLCTSCSVAHLDEAAAIAPYYAAIEALGPELGLPVASLHRYWDRTAGADQGLFGWDGIHPTDAGHQVMAEGLLAAVIDGGHEEG